MFSIPGRHNAVRELFAPKTILTLDRHTAAW